MCGACGERGAAGWARPFLASLPARNAVAAAVKPFARPGLRVATRGGGWLVTAPTGRTFACDGLTGLVAAARPSLAEPGEFVPRGSGVVTVPEPDARRGVRVRIDPGEAPRWLGDGGVVREPDAAVRWPGDLDPEATSRWLGDGGVVREPDATPRWPGDLDPDATPRWPGDGGMARDPDATPGWLGDEVVVPDADAARHVYERLSRPPWSLRHYLAPSGPARLTVPEPGSAADLLVWLELARPRALTARCPLDATWHLDVEIRDGHVVRACAAR